MVPGGSSALGIPEEAGLVDADLDVGALEGDVPAGGGVGSASEPKRAAKVTSAAWMPREPKPMKDPSKELPGAGHVHRVRRRLFTGKWAAIHRVFAHSSGVTLTRGCLRRLEHVDLVDVDPGAELLGVAGESTPR